jgi:DNA-binding GntR family transcriptional regulator
LRKKGIHLKSTTRLKNRKLGEVERVYGILRELIITAKIPPGEFLPEEDLAARCRTSRTPVREACTRLMQDKWLSRIPRKGFLVTPVSNRDIVEMYEYRRILECFATEKVAQSATPEQVAELKAILDAENVTGTQLDEILSANEKFHRRLSELAGNQRVIGQLGLTLAYVTRLASLCTQTVPGFHSAHLDIVRAIESHQPAEARAAMASHIDISRDQMIQMFGR